MLMAVTRKVGAGLRNGAIRGALRVAAPGGGNARLCVLLYHRVRAAPDEFDGWNMTAQQFEQQIGLLATCFRPLPLSEAFDRLRSGSLPRGSVAVTFDDGYADNAEVALPILARYGVPAAFFITTGYLDGGRMWNDTIVEAVRVLDRPELDLTAWGLGRLPVHDPAQRRVAIVKILTALKHLSPVQRDQRAAELEALATRSLPRDLMLRSDQVRALRAAGMEIGAHTVTHPILSRLGAQEARREIRASREHLEALLGEPITLFAYPNGKPGHDYGVEHVAMVREAGFRAAWSTAEGAATRGSDPHQLPRFKPWQPSPARLGLDLVRAFRAEAAPRS
jgi:peptidoglycan/xylan/chitin deacetylase (PgdA/CDA1 family)